MHKVPKCVQSFQGNYSSTTTLLAHVFVVVVSFITSSKPKRELSKRAKMQKVNDQGGIRTHASFDTRSSDRDLGTRKALI